MSTLISLQTIISEFIAKKQARIEKAKLLNEGVEPTEDRLHRLHAPHDGYIWGDLANDVYLGGQYLPDPDTSNINPKKTKVKILTTLKETIKEVFKPFERTNSDEISFGKEWTQKEGDVCYAYISDVPLSIVYEIDKLGLIYEESKPVVNEYYFNDNGEVVVNVISSKNIATFSNDYGNVYIEELTLDNGIKITFKGSLTNALWALGTLRKCTRQNDFHDNVLINNLEKNVSIELKGVIKHSEYKGIKQTLLTKAKLTTNEVNDWYYIQQLGNVEGVDKLTSHEKKLIKKYNLK